MMIKINYLRRGEIEHKRGGLALFWEGSRVDLALGEEDERIW